YQVFFTEQVSSQLPLSNNASVSDADDANLIELKVTLMNPTTDESLSYTIPGGQGITASESGGVYTFSGRAPVNVYADVLRSIRYDNMADEFTGVPPQPQVVSFQVTDERNGVSVAVETTVNLIPFDDNPFVGPDNISATVDENAMNVFFDLTATDADQGMTDVIIANISSVDPPELFSIVSLGPQVIISDGSTSAQQFSWRLRLTQPIDYERYQSLRVVITFWILGFRIDVYVHITISNLNDVAPVISPLPSPYDVMEMLPVNTRIGLQVNATDADGDTLLYEVIEGRGFIDIDNDRELYVSNVIDREGLPGDSFNVTVHVFDGVHSAFATLTVIVIDINDHSPEFDELEYTFQV
ncbi:MAG: cadherin repeat domain-containing protein, partial [Alphaproteobacteria bacterium]|nr:cadherin repeat domain-containing protein [Alphaproteobacteria bacterium]